jgi:membrane protein DedA with SNARE-associated domain
MTFAEFGNEVIAFVRTHQVWAAPVVFALAFGESLAFVSLFLPATVIIATIGGFLGAGGADFWAVFLAAGVGGALGYALSYWIGLYFKNDIHRVWPFTRYPDMLPRGHEFFEKYGFFAVFLGHFFGPVRAVIPVVAGMVAMPQLQFQIANITSAFLWAAGVLGSTMFGMKWLTDVLAASAGIK